ncbi:MAG: 4-hydroxy-3-methylbut-2-enyl diphosphate reductase [Burkholderiales bacterium]|nr:4-hydroxy-3-methylbut-2-enyl diphosphate reductase [Burkholderiales bacterium]
MPARPGRRRSPGDRAVAGTGIRRTQPRAGAKTVARGVRRQCRCRRRRRLSAGRRGRFPGPRRRALRRRAEGTHRALRAVRFQPPAGRPADPFRSPDPGHPIGATAMEALLAQPRGFCAGVDRAIEIVERALETFGRPVYVRHEIVHNEHVVGALRDKGAVFVDELDEVPDGAVVIFSAHGVSRAVRDEAGQRELRVFDATCPLVTKVHVEVAKMRREGREVIMIGHAGHPEVEGTMGQVGDGIHLVESAADVARLDVTDPQQLAFVTQTTLSVDDCRDVIAALKARFPAIAEPKKQDICYATQNRQDAVKFMAPQCDLVLVIGSPTSSNSNRLREVAEKMGREARMIGSAAELDPAWLVGKRSIGVTAGASAPERLVEDLLARLRELGVERVRALPGVEEHMTFPLPKGLARPAAGA